MKRMANVVQQATNYDTPEQGFRSIWNRHQKLLQMMQACGYGQKIRPAGAPELRIDPSMVLDLEFSIFFLAGQIQMIGQALAQVTELDPIAAQLHPSVKASRKDGQNGKGEKDDG